MVRIADILRSHTHFAHETLPVLREAVVGDEQIVADRLGDEIEVAKRVQCFAHFAKSVLLEEDASHFRLTGVFSENLEFVSCVEDTSLDPLQLGKVDFRHCSSFWFDAVWFIARLDFIFQGIFVRLRYLPCP